MRAEVYSGAKDAMKSHGTPRVPQRHSPVSEVWSPHLLITTTCNLLWPVYKKTWMTVKLHWIVLILLRDFQAEEATTHQRSWLWNDLWKTECQNSLQLHWVSKTRLSSCSYYCLVRRKQSFDQGKNQQNHLRGDSGQRGLSGAYQQTDQETVQNNNRESTQQGCSQLHAAQPIW